MNKKILVGTEEIMKYIGISAPDLFRKFIKSGMPAKKINDRWYAHTENLDRYFQKITNFRNSKTQVEAD